MGPKQKNPDRRGGIHNNTVEGERRDLVKGVKIQVPENGIGAR